MRKGLITFRSPVLQHFFDCPLQFGAVPEHTNASDYAEDADLFELAVQVCLVDDTAAVLVQLHQHAPVIAAWPHRELPQIHYVIVDERHTCRHSLGT